MTYFYIEIIFFIKLMTLFSGNQYFIKKIINHAISVPLPSKIVHTL